MQIQINDFIINKIYHIIQENLLECPHCANQFRSKQPTAI